MAFTLAVPMGGGATLVAFAQKWFRLQNLAKDKASDGSETKVDEPK